MNDSRPIQQPVATAMTRKRRRLSPVWTVPMVAGFIAIYLGWHTLSERGEEVTISFNTADGIIAGQTQIKYKAVSLGTVSEISLDQDHKHVVVKAKMTRDAHDLLTDHTRFWVVRPRLAYGSLSGFETLVSGAYIQCDPNGGGGKSQDRFTGLEEPPGVRADEPGTIYKLQADKLSSITVGSPVYYRDINVGEVLHYDIGDGYGPIEVSIFVHAPYDKFVHSETRFWNSSGVNANLGPAGLQVRFQSIQSLLMGGVTFATKKEYATAQQADKETHFKLYDDQGTAEVGDLHKHISYVTYFESPVTNLQPGSPVNLYGIQIGEVRDVKLLFDPRIPEAKVRVAFDIQPERAFQLSDDDAHNALEITRRMVNKGFRVEVDAGLIPGKTGLAIEKLPDAKPTEVAMEGDAIVMPSSASGGVGGVLDKLNHIPFAQIGHNLNALIERANGSMQSIDEKSDFQRDVKRAMDQVGDAARSVRLMTDFLNQHPEALIRGRDTKEK
ncbi:MAG TPA: MlaD family protein [Rickettsiales bacterium]|nr:MlaD family protein [Rickettsiales bacterium]